MAKGAIYTIGYVKLTPVRLMEILDLLRIDFLYDCRSSPQTRVRGFGHRQLEAFLPNRYQWRGRTLGGRARILGSKIDALATEAWAGARIMLMCMEESPGECHRHHDIARTLLMQDTNVQHIYRREVVDARTLQQAIDDGSAEYDCEDLYEHAAREVDTLRAQLQRLKGDDR